MNAQHPEDIEQMFRAGTVRTLSIEHGDWIILFAAWGEYPFSVRPKASSFGSVAVFTRLDSALRFIKSEEKSEGRS
jgi:hypothetical protein